MEAQPVYIKSSFNEWKENCFKRWEIHMLQYVRTYSIDEFKRFFNTPSVIIKKHPAGFLFFETKRFDDWGLVAFNHIPKEPLISLVYHIKYKFFFVLHEKGRKPSSIKIESERLRKSLKDAHLTFNSSQSHTEHNQYIEESYMDAFEGDFDAYWNID